MRLQHFSSVPFLNDSDFRDVQPQLGRGHRSLKRSDDINAWDFCCYSADDNDDADNTTTTTTTTNNNNNNRPCNVTGDQTLVSQRRTSSPKPGDSIVMSVVDKMALQHILFSVS